MSDHRIRIAGEADYTQWHLLWQAYLVFYESSLDESVTRGLWQRILCADDPIQCRVAATEDDRLLGLVHFFPHPHSWYNSPVCYLNDLYVLPETRGCGVGEQLINAVVTEAGDQGWAEVYWHTQNNNKVARGLYDKLTGGTDGFINYTIDMSRRHDRG